MSASDDDAEQAEVWAPDDPRADFIEDLGLLVEEAGWLPRMSGRVLGWLLVAGTPQTQADICRRVQASRATVSTVTRSLLDKKLIRRVTHSGDHGTYLEVRDDAWLLMEQEGLRVVRRYRELAEGIASAVPGQRPRSTQPVRDMAVFFAIAERRLVDEIKEIEKLTHHQAKASEPTTASTRSPKRTSADQRPPREPTKPL